MINIGTKNEINRNKWVARILKGLPNGAKILDAGAGEQQYRKYCKHLKYTPQDFDKYDGKGDLKGLQTGNGVRSRTNIVSDITKIPRANNSFDVIMCTEVFEHLPEPLKAIKEFSRLLKPSGYLILTAPFCSLTHYSPYHFYSGFNRYFYESALKKFGFEIKEIKTNGNYFEYLAQEIRRVPEVARRYSEYNLINKVIFSLAYRQMIPLLGILDKKDRDSSELLCFGYHVLAQKYKSKR